MEDTADFQDFKIVDECVDNGVDSVGSKERATIAKRLLAEMAAASEPRSSSATLNYTLPKVIDARGSQKTIHKSQCSAFVSSTEVNSKKRKRTLDYHHHSTYKRSHSSKPTDADVNSRPVVKRQYNHNSKVCSPGFSSGGKPRHHSPNPKEQNGEKNSGITVEAALVQGDVNVCKERLFSVMPLVPTCAAASSIPITESCANSLVQMHFKRTAQSSVKLAVSDSAKNLFDSVKSKTAVANCVTETTKCNGQSLSAAAAENNVAVPSTTCFSQLHERSKPAPNVAAYLDSLSEITYDVEKYCCFYCNPCNSLLSTAQLWEEHLTSQDHAKKLSIWRECHDLHEKKLLSSDVARSQKEFNQRRHGHAGAEFVIELENSRLRKPERFVCTLCNVSAPSLSSMLEHMTLSTHTEAVLAEVAPADLPIFRGATGNEENDAILRRERDELVSERIRRLESRGRPLLRHYVGLQHLKDPVISAADSRQELAAAKWKRNITTDNVNRPKFKKLSAEHSLANLLNARFDLKLTGLRYFLEIWPPRRIVAPFYYCALCDYLMPSITHHCKSLKHRAAYCKKHYVSIYESIGVEATTEEEFKDALLLAEQKTVLLENPKAQVECVVELCVGERSVFVALNAKDAKDIMGEIQPQIVPFERLTSVAVPARVKTSFRASVSPKNNEAIVKSSTTESLLQANKVVVQDASVCTEMDSPAILQALAKADAVAMSFAGVPGVFKPSQEINEQAIRSFCFKIGAQTLSLLMPGLQLSFDETSSVSERRTHAAIAVDQSGLVTAAPPSPSAVVVAHKACFPLSAQDGLTTTKSSDLVSLPRPSTDSLRSIVPETTDSVVVSCSHPVIATLDNKPVPATSGDEISLIPMPVGKNVVAGVDAATDSHRGHMLPENSTHAKKTHSPPAAYRSSAPLPPRKRNDSAAKPNESDRVDRSHRSSAVGKHVADKLSASRDPRASPNRSSAKQYSQHQRRRHDGGKEASFKPAALARRH